MKKTFLTSRHRFAYMWIALKHFTTPWRVYALAHGKHHHKKDRGIMHDLAARNIVHSNHH